MPRRLRPDDGRLSLDTWAPILGIPVDSLKFARRHGQFPTGSLPEGLGVASARACRARGASLEAAGNLLGYISGLSVEALERIFGAGRTHALVVGKLVLPKLVRPDDVIQNETVRGCLPAAWAQGLYPALINIEAIWRAILAAVAKLDTPAGRNCPQVTRTQ
jgi:hypothetical protein